MKQKAKYVANPHATFNVGTMSFPYGVWIECPAGVLDMIKRAGVKVVEKFVFDPPLEPEASKIFYTTNEHYGDDAGEGIAKVEVKPRSKKRHKTSKQEADE